MSNYIELAILGISALCLVFGILLGLLRGARRSVLRLIMILLCVVAAFLLKDVVADLVLTHEIVDAETGLPVTIEEYVINMLPEQLAQLGPDFVVPLMKMILGVVLFLALFLVMQIVTWIVLFPIFKLLLGKGKSKHRLFGAAFGLVQGAAVALCICIPLTGLLAQVNKLAVVADSLQGVETASALAEDDSPEGGSTGGSSSQLGYIIDMYAEYEQSVVGQTFLTIGEKPFEWISSTKTEDGRTVTLAGQVDTTVVLVRLFVEIASCLGDLQNIDFTDLSSLTALESIFGKLDAVKEGLSDEVKATLNNIVGTAIDAIPVPDGVNDATKVFVENFKDVLKQEDFTEIGFANEISVISNVTATLEKDELTVKDLSDIINDLSESKIIVPMLDSAEAELNLSNSQKAQLETAIEQLPPETNQETLEIFRKLVGLQTAPQA